MREEKKKQKKKKQKKNKRKRRERRRRIGKDLELYDVIVARGRRGKEEGAGAPTGPKVEEGQQG